MDYWIRNTASHWCVFSLAGEPVPGGEWPVRVHSVGYGQWSGEDGQDHLQVLSSYNKREWNPKTGTMYTAQCILYYVIVQYCRLGQSFTLKSCLIGKGGTSKWPATFSRMVWQVLLRICLLRKQEHDDPGNVLLHMIMNTLLS